MSQLSRFARGAAAVAFAVGTCAVAIAQSPPQTEQFIVTLSDPSRPGRINLDLLHGGVTVRGSNRADIAIVARPREDRARPSRGNASGLRRLAQPAGFSVEEDRNELTIEGASMNQPIDFELLVPTRTNLKLEVVNGGNIVVENVDGELEIGNTNGGITLTNVAGTVIASTTNGGVKASMTSLAAKRPMAFTSLNGNVDVTLPASARANLRLRSDMGEVLSDFDVQVRPAPPATVSDNRRGGGRFQIEVNKSIYGTINGGGPDIEMRTFNGNVFLRKGQ
jgi:acetylornithine deacetylase/succinyl-diaminopimelate desuccinylase-like protein